MKRGAVPFDSRRENPALRAAISRALSATQVEVRPAETVDPAHPEISQPMLLADSDRELSGFHGSGILAVPITTSRSPAQASA